MFYIAVCTLLVFFSSLIFAENISYILIHGTWAKNAPWYQEGGDFFDTLSCVIDKTDEIISFSWSGNCSESDRRIAAITLVQLLREKTLKNKKIVIIAHSHGGNVALHALEYIKYHKIDIFIDFLVLLGTPIAHNYALEHVSVKLIMNIFSFGDLIQPVFGLFKRTLQKNEQSINLHMILYEKEPKHNQLYTPLFACNITQLYQMSSVIMKDNERENIYRLELAYSAPPRILKEKNIEVRLMQDQIFQEYVLSHLLWGKEEALYFLP